MKKKKLLTPGIALLLGAMTLTGCGKTGEAVSEQPAQSATNAVEAADSADATEASDTTVTETADDSTADAPDDTEENTAEEEALAEKEELAKAKIRHEYANILSGLTSALILPEMDAIESPYEYGYEMDENTFGIHDVDLDGRDELIINYTSSYMAGMFSVIYDYNPDSDTLTKQLLEWPALIIYSNGIIEAQSSHNQTQGDMWPFTLYRYDAATDTYVSAGYADSWSKEIFPTYYDYETESNLPFPDELDKDQDGVLYNIQKNPEEITWGYDTYIYDNAEFDAWKNEWIAGSDIVDIEYKSVNYDNFCDFTKNYLSLTDASALKQYPDNGTDFGMLFTSEDTSLKELETLLKEQYGLTLEQPYDDFEEEIIAKSGDTQVASFYYLNAGSVTLENERIDDVTIFGIYPGMDVNEAKERLSAHGFVLSSEDSDSQASYNTGDGLGNRAVFLQYQDGKVTSVSVGPYCAYAG